MKSRTNVRGDLSREITPTSTWREITWDTSSLPLLGDILSFNTPKHHVNTWTHHVSPNIVSRLSMRGDLVSPSTGHHSHDAGIHFLPRIASMWERHCLLPTLQPLSTSNLEDRRHDPPRKNRRRGRIVSTRGKHCSDAGEASSRREGTHRTPITNNLDPGNTSLLHREESASRKSGRPVVPFTGKGILSTQKRKKKLFHPERNII